jgi:uncharacterized membrane protein YdjX (TVP38/TMEM64 family)
MMDWVNGIVEHAAGLGVPVFLVLYLLANMLPVPSWPFTVAAGAWFGFSRGVALAIAMNFAGSVCAFLLSRYVFKSGVQKMLARRPKLKAVDSALREGGWKAVWLLQMSPAVPFGLQNYFLGASKVTTRSYLMGSAISGLPSAMIYVGIGAGARFVTTLDSRWKWAGLGVGILGTVVLSIWMSRIIKSRLARAA